MVEAFLLACAAARRESSLHIAVRTTGIVISERALERGRERRLGLIAEAAQLQIIALSTQHRLGALQRLRDRKSTRLNSSHVKISYAVFCLKKKKNQEH